MTGGHKQVECKAPTCNGTCNACGLKRCSVCNSAETSLPTECPGRRMSVFEETNVVKVYLTITTALGGGPVERGRQSDRTKQRPHSRRTTLHV